MNTHPETSGRLIRWAHWYDAFTHVLSLGRIKHLRQQFLDFAQLRPSMSVLDVGCGTGELTLMAKTRVGHRPVGDFASSADYFLNVCWLSWRRLVGRNRPNCRRFCASI